MAFPNETSMIAFGSVLLYIGIMSGLVALPLIISVIIDYKELYRSTSIIVLTVVSLMLLYYGSSYVMLSKNGKRNNNNNRESYMNLNDKLQDQLFLGSLLILISMFILFKAYYNPYSRPRNKKMVFIKLFLGLIPLGVGVWMIDEATKKNSVISIF